MGLDIHFGVDTEKNIITSDYFSDEKFYHQHKLSRTFCNFMFRQYSSSGIPELDQIGELTGLDISPIYEMEHYMTDHDINEKLSELNEEWEKKHFLKTIKSNREKLKGNIDILDNLLTQLIDKLSKVKNLQDKLDHGDFDSLNSDIYFSNFNSEESESHVRDNFGQDLRNFKRFAEYAKSKGVTTIFFKYG